MLIKLTPDVLDSFTTIEVHNENPKLQLLIKQTFQREVTDKYVMQRLIKEYKILIHGHEFGREGLNLLLG